jgi:hypothetical protein
MALINGDELGAEAEADDGDVEFFGHDWHPLFSRRGIKRAAAHDYRENFGEGKSGRLHKKRKSRMKIKIRKMIRSKRKIKSRT